MVPASDDQRVLKLPYRGAPQTVAVITDAALRSQDYYNVRLLAEYICEGIPSKDYASEALAIYYWVLGNTRYMRDPRTVELVRAPHIIVAEIEKGKRPGLDCDDMTGLILGLGLAAGFESRSVTAAFRNVFYKGNRQYSHVFPQLCEPRTRAWLTVDPVAAENTNRMLKRVVAAKIWPVA